MGNGKIGRFIGGASNVVSIGNAGWGIGCSIDDLDFEPIAKPYEPKGLHSNEQKVSTQYTRPPTDEKPFDKQEAQALVDSFRKDNGARISRTNGCDKKGD